MASIKKNPNGTYTVRWRATPGAKVRQPQQTFARRTDAERFARHIETAKDRGEYIDPAAAKTNLAQWLTHWHRSRLNLRPSTATRDETYLRRYLIEPLGHHTLGTLQPHHIRSWVADMATRYAPATVRKAHQLLKAALQTAVDDRMIPTNPATNTPLPAIDDPTHRYLTLDQVHHLATSIHPRWKAFVYTGALAGLRPGELCALRTTNLNLKDQRLTVTHTATEHRGHITYGPPKTKAALRTISIGTQLTDILRTHLHDHGTNVIDLTAPPLVFTAPEGGPLRRSTFRRRQWADAVNRSVGPPMRIHDLRHTAAALAISQGVHPKVLQERLGHRDIATTLDVYGGLFHGYDEGIAEALDTAFLATMRDDSAATSRPTRPSRP